MLGAEIKVWFRFMPALHESRDTSFSKVVVSVVLGKTRHQLEVGKTQAWRLLQMVSAIYFYTWSDLSHRAKFCRLWALHRQWNLAVALQRWCHQFTIASQRWRHPSSSTHGDFYLHKIFKHAHLKFMVYGSKQASKQHTHVRAQCSPASLGLTQARIYAMQPTSVEPAQACPN